MSQQGDNNQPQPQVIINNNARNNNGNAEAESKTSFRLHIHDDLSENNIEPGQRTLPEQVEEPVEEPQQEKEKHEPTPEEMLIKLLQGLTTVLDKRKDTKEVNENPIAWLEAFEAAAIANKISDERILEIVSNYLKEVAFT